MVSVRRTLIERNICTSLFIISSIISISITIGIIVHGMGGVAVEA